MRKDRIREVKKAMMESHTRVDMGCYYSSRRAKDLLDPDYGSVGCIAGFTIALFDPTHSENEDDFDKAQELLDLTYYEAKRLFMPQFMYDGGPGVKSIAKVVEHIDEFLEIYE